MRRICDDHEQMHCHPRLNRMLRMQKRLMYRSKSSMSHVSRSIVCSLVRGSSGTVGPCIGHGFCAAESTQLHPVGSAVASRLQQKIDSRQCEHSFVVVELPLVEYILRTLRKRQDFREPENFPPNNNIRIMVKTK